MSISLAELLERIEAIRARIEAGAAPAERSGELSADVLEALGEMQLTNLYLPRSLGGLEVEPVVAAEAVQAVARIDSAAAWMLMVANVPRFLASHWPAELVEEIWGENTLAIAAISGNQAFTATPIDGGYRVNGQTGFASGCNQAAWFVAPVRILGSESPGRGMLIVPMQRCEIVPNWQVLGMRGTGSHDVRIVAGDIDARYVLRFTAQQQPNRYFDGALYRCARRVVFATYVPISLALAERGLEALTALASGKTPYGSDATLMHRPLAQHKFGRALGLYGSGRRYFHGALRDAYARAQAGAAPSERERADLYLAAVQAVQSAAESLRLTADAAGSSVIYTRSPFERLLRDMEVLRQHGFTSDNRFANVAQVYWGANLDYPQLLQ